MREPSGHPLRFRLFQLAAAALLPLALAAIASAVWLVVERREETQRSALEVSRALAVAVEAELRATMAVLDSLGQSEELLSGELERFRPFARRTGERQGWRTVIVADATGKVLMNAVLPEIPVGQAPVDPDSMAKAIATLKPVVGRVAGGPRGIGPAFAIRIPVLQEGALRYVLTAVIPTDRVFSIVTRQNVPSSWVVGVFDQTGGRVARSRDNSVARASPTLQALLDEGRPEGMGPTYTLEGVQSYTGYKRLMGSGWSVAVGISSAEANSAVYPLVAAMAIGLFASFGLSALLAWWVAGQVSQPIDRLKESAARLGRGEDVAHVPLRVAELDEVSQALVRAAHERSEAAREREALLARVTDALRLAEDAGRTKDEFLAVLGHELRNPLAPISTALHIMERKGDASTRVEREVMQRQLVHMTRLVDDLLDVSRITGKRLAMQFQPLKAAALIRSAAQAAATLMRDRQFNVRISPEAEEAWLPADEVRLAQVLNNLLVNAAKFTSRGGRIELAAAVEDGVLVIEVRDDGIGMPREVLGSVFETFYQAPQASDRRMGGLGLGLAIARSLVEMHGGAIQASSGGSGNGSVFQVRLPTMHPPEPPGDAAPEAADASGAGRVLVVDDNRDAADTAAALIEMAGFEVRVAYEPAAAQEVFAAFAPAVAVLDIGLPGMSGYELVGLLKSHANGNRCRFIALTGYGTQADIARAHEAGFDTHISKPAAPDALMESVRRLAEAA